MYIIIQQGGILLNILSTAISQNARCGHKTGGVIDLDREIRDDTDEADQKLFWLWPVANFFGA